MNDWVNIDERLPHRSTVCFCKRATGEVTKVYFNEDGLAWRCYYGFKPVYWQNSEGEEVCDVTHWKPLNGDLFDTT